jgi:hypothetical protein
MPNPTNSNPTPSQILPLSVGRIFALGAVVLATIGYLIFHFKTHDAHMLATAAEHLLEGRTHWITFQNRLLAPWLIEGIRIPLGLTWIQAYRALIAATMAGGAVILLLRSWQTTGSSRHGLIQSGLWFLFTVLFNHFWSYPWDYTGALLFLLIILWLRDRLKKISDLKSGTLVALIILLALNRESSLFVITSLMAAVAIFGYYKRQLRTAGLTIVALGFAGATNVVGVIWIRTALFVSPTRPLGTEGPEAAMGNFLQPRINWFVFRNMLHDWYHFAGTVIAVSLVIVSLVMLKSLVCDFFGPRHLPFNRILVYILFGTATVAILLFGYAPELRVYFEHIPILVLLLTEFSARDDSAKAI